MSSRETDHQAVPGTAVYWRQVLTV